MKYQITISVNSLDIPISENIPQHATAIFETTADKKEECISKILIGMGKAWPAFQKQYEGNHYQQIILTPINGETILPISSGKNIKLISRYENFFNKIKRLLKWKN